MTPRGTCLLLKVAAQATKTLGGILLPEQSQVRPTSGDVVQVSAAGGKYQMRLKEGDTVLYSKFGIGVTDLNWKGETFALIREQDVIGTLPRSDATVEDMGALEPQGDRILLQVDAAASQTEGGVMLTDSAKEKPQSGTVVRVGPGRQDDDGTVHAPKLKAGDRVLFFKYAGDTVETSGGETFNVLHESDCLAKI